MNVLIAVVIALVLGVAVRLDPTFSFNLQGGFWQHLMTWNILMVVFNMVPAFPMDGGRVLRALLAMVMDYGKATRWAATIGQGLAAVVVMVMLLSGTFQPFLLLIAFFIFMAAGQEASVVTQQEATRSLLVQDAMQTEFHALPPGAELKLAVDHLLAGTQQDFPVMDENGDFSGMLNRHQLISALSEHGANHPARAVMEVCDIEIPAHLGLSEALETLSASACHALPVLDPVTGRLVGLLTAENVGELMLVKAALRPR